MCWQQNYPLSASSFGKLACVHLGQAVLAEGVIQALALELLLGERDECEVPERHWGWADGATAPDSAHHAIAAPVEAWPTLPLPTTWVSPLSAMAAPRAAEETKYGLLSGGRVEVAEVEEGLAGGPQHGLIYSLCSDLFVWLCRS